MNKSIVVCYDGTSNEYGRNNTNVVKTFEAIVRDESQVAFYDPGVGTLSIFGRTIGRKVGVLLGLAFGYGIRQNIEDGYEYLLNKYQEGDSLYLFGFSRGAYTARALAGMIHEFGILHKDYRNLIPYVSKRYFKKKEKKDQEVIRRFKGTFSQDCVPYFIGIWDTVGALGKNLSKKFHNKTLNTGIKYGYHAIAIDEKRRTYRVNLWDKKDDEDDQVIEQVGFAGAHSDVGGGCQNNESDLSDIAFVWMMDKASECGLKLKKDWKECVSQNATGKMHNSWKWLYIIYGWPSKRKIREDIKIHQSVGDRIKKLGKYRPPSLNGKTEDRIIVTTDSYKCEAQGDSSGVVI